MRIFPEELVTRRETSSLLLGVIVPRPIALVSTVGENGVFNVAPYSGGYTSLCFKPPMLALQIGWTRDGRKKDTLRNIEFSKEFVVNVVTESMAEAMNQSSIEYPPEVSEFEKAKLTPVKSDCVKAPRVGESPINMECRLAQILEFGQAPTGSHAVIGEVLMVHVRDELWVNSQIDMSGLKAIARLGGHFYCRTTDLFEMERPPGI